jgi:hypothetical protein
MSDDLPTAVWSGSFMLGNVEMRCHVLSTGERIIEADSVAALFADDSDMPDVDMSEFVRWMRSRP